MAHYFFRRGETGIETDGGKHGLHRVRQYRRPSETAALQFSRPQIQPVADVHFQRDFRQHMLVDQVCAQTGKLAFGQLREGVKQHFGDAVI